MSFRGGRVVGRDDELGHFDRLVRGVAAGRGGAIWVEGEAGIGKSALLTAGLSGAEGLGCQVHRAAADELGRRFPLQVMLDCLDVLPATTDPVRRPVAEALRVRSHARAAALDPVPAAAEELMGLLERLCARPLVLAVDDLQWADDASLLVWHWLGRRIGQLPLLLVAAHRPVPLQAQVARLRHQAADAGATMLELARLPEEAVAGLVADLTGAEAVGPRLRAAMTGAGGNPLYVREMVDALARERLLSTAGRTVELAGAAGTDTVPDVPMSLVAAISDRLGFLSEDT
ncbi:MAG TPA: ATP-binding protein, partial [Mycobacteriales bacterium]